MNLSPDPLWTAGSQHARDPGSSCEEGIEDSRASWVVVAWPEKKEKSSKLQA